MCGRFLYHLGRAPMLRGRVVPDHLAQEITQLTLLVGGETLKAPGRSRHASLDVRRYMDTMMALPAFQEWTSAGLAETLVIEKLETA